MGAPSIFICYRRVDAGWAGRLEGELGEHFGCDAVFRDRRIPAGANWRTHIENALDNCKVMLVLIGPSWTRPTGTAGANRLWDAEDMVRREIERGLQRADIPVIPVLCDDAVMPVPGQLPPGLQAICDLQAMSLSDPRWAFDAGELCKCVASFVAPRKRPLVDVAPSRVPAPMAGAMAAVAAVAAWLAWPLAQSLPDRPQAASRDAIFSADWTQVTVERVASYAAERAVLWAIVAALVLGAAYAGMRELRAGAPAGLMIGLSSGALAGAIGGALFIVLKDVAGVTSLLLLNGIGVAIAGGVLAGRFATLGGDALRSTLRTVGLGGGLVAGALGSMLFDHDPKLAFTTQAVVLIGTLAAVLAAPSLAPAGLPAGSAVEL
jgi:hypothetical protein